MESLQADTIVVLCDGETERGPRWVQPTLERVLPHHPLVFMRALSRGDGSSRARGGLGRELPARGGLTEPQSVAMRRLSSASRLRRSQGRVPLLRAGGGVMVSARAERSPPSPGCQQPAGPVHAWAHHTPGHVSRLAGRPGCPSRIYEEGTPSGESPQGASKALPLIESASEGQSPTEDEHADRAESEESLAATAETLG